MSTQTENTCLRCRKDCVPLFNSQITGNQYNIMERLCDMPAWTKPFAGLEHHADWRMDVIHPDAVLMAAAPIMFEALEKIAAVNEFNTSDMCWVVGLAKSAINQVNAELCGGEAVRTSAVLCADVGEAR